MPAERLRILTTNDFAGSFFPQPTSYGVLPGGAGLMAAVERLRDEADASLWIDVGDFANGGPLAPLSNGTAGFLAAATLGVDATVAGNHELDWGPEHLRRWAPELRCPLLCANLDLGLPGTALLPAGDWTVGVIGLTHPAVGQFVPWVRQQQPDPVAIVQHEARELRRRGADVVVLAIHDGVAWSGTPDGAPVVDPSSMVALCRRLVGCVDAVLGAHTLVRHIGNLAGIPYLQPWLFGAEVGVLDLFPDGRHRAFGVMVEDAGPWDGPGGRLFTALQAEIVGEIAEPWLNRPVGPAALVAQLADSARRLTEADLAIVGRLMLHGSQPMIDGTSAYLPPGPVSEALVLRLVPWSDDELYLGEVSGAEAERLARAIGGPFGGQRFGPAEVARRTPRTESGVVALETWSAQLADHWLGRAVGWSRTGTGLRDALRAAITG